MIKLLNNQIKVIKALIIRELLTRFGRENIGFLWFIGEPILFCAGVTVIWTAVRSSHEHGLPMTAIVITGYVPLTMWRHCIGRSTAAFTANGSLLFHRQVSPLAIISARAYIEIIGAIGAGFLLCIGAIILGYMDPPKEYGLLLCGVIYQAFFSFATALIISSLTEINDIIEKIVGLFSYIAIPFSGAFSMVDWIPQKYRWALMISPSVESVEMIRGGQFGSIAHAHYNIVYATYINLFLMIIGLYLCLKVKKYISIN